MRPEFSSARQLQSNAPVKFAGPSASRRAESSSGVNTSSDGGEKKIVVVDGEPVSSTRLNVGTSGANRDMSMPYSANNKSPAADFSGPVHVVSPESIKSGPTANVAETTTPVTVQAPRLVQEIREIADRISVIDRNSVEVRFDFSDADRLSVRVEYRDGTVHTTFRTDSHQLRDAISHEWQLQSTAADQPSYRLAEPIFKASETSQQDFSSLGDGSGRQRASEQPAQSATPSPAPNGRRDFSMSKNMVPAPAVRALRPETSHHLHVFA
jgi:hypothetical protein